VTIHGTVPVSSYTQYANALYYVEAGTYGGYRFREGYYRNNRNAGGSPVGSGDGGNGGNNGGGGGGNTPKPVTVVGGSGTAQSPYQLEEFVVRAQVPATKYTYYGAGLYLLQAGTYAGNAYPAGYYRDHSAVEDNDRKAGSTFPSKNVIDFTKNPCIKDIITKLFGSKSNLFSDILNKTFGNDSDAELDIRFAENTLTGTTDGKTSGTQYSYDIFLNEVMMARNSSKQYITSTMIHELLHAYMDYESRVKKNPIFLGKSESQQHEYMAVNYVDDMRDIIIALYPDFNVDEAEALAWGGLEGTAAYQTQVVAAGKETFKNNVNLREKNVTGNNNWHGKPCGN
jgi:hypothetical protein